jgi:protein phosphatase 1L
MSQNFDPQLLKESETFVVHKRKSSRRSQKKNRQSQERTASSDATETSSDDSVASHSDIVASKSSRFRVGVADAIGLRDANEDALLVSGRLGGARDQDLFALFDGHGGNEASIRASNLMAEALLKQLEQHKRTEHALKAAFADVHERIIADVDCGTTACVCYVTADTLFAASVGDSRAIVVKHDGAFARLTHDHKPTDATEAAAVEERGGFIVRERVGGQLAMTRALGDRPLAPFLSHEPDIVHVPLDDIALVLLMCDGITDVLTDGEIVGIVRSAVDKHRVDQVAERIRNAALQAQSTDNVSVMVIQKITSSSSKTEDVKKK